MGALIPAPNEFTKQNCILYTIKHDKYCLPFIDLAVGARVMVTRNLATQIGIYNELLLDFDFINSMCVIAGGNVRK